MWIRSRSSTYQEIAINWILSIILKNILKFCIPYSAIPIKSKVTFFLCHWDFFTENINACPLLTVTIDKWKWYFQKNFLFINNNYWPIGIVPESFPYWWMALKKYLLSRNDLWTVWSEAPNSIWFLCFSIFCWRTDGNTKYILVILEGGRGHSKKYCEYQVESGICRQMNAIFLVQRKRGWRSMTAVLIPKNWKKGGLRWKFSKWG